MKSITEGLEEGRNMKEAGPEAEVIVGRMLLHAASWLVRPGLFIFSLFSFSFLFSSSFL